MATPLASMLDNAVELLSRPYSVHASVIIPPGGAEGVIACCGNGMGGYCLFMQDAHVFFVHNYVGLLEIRATSRQVVHGGALRIRFSYEPPDRDDSDIGTPGIGRLYLNGSLAGTQRFPVTIPLAFPMDAGFTAGRNPGSAISTLYESPYPFTGRIVSASHEAGTNWPMNGVLRLR
jgi:arylsulfatase